MFIHTAMYIICCTALVWLRFNTLFSCKLLPNVIVLEREPVHPWSGVSDGGRDGGDVTSKRHPDVTQRQPLLYSAGI